jgi:hypothetical protein
MLLCKKFHVSFHLNAILYVCTPRGCSAQNYSFHTRFLLVQIWILVCSDKLFLTDFLLNVNVNVPSTHICAPSLWALIFICFIFYMISPLPPFRGQSYGAVTFRAATHLRMTLLRIDRSSARNQTRNYWMAVWRATIELPHPSTNEPPQGSFIYNFYKSI